MRELFQMLRKIVNGGEDAVLVTIVASSGSTPRGAGARMLVTQVGRVCGTIGGGAVEHQAEQIAEQVLREKRSFTEQFYLRKNEIQDLGMICGGDVNVYFSYIAARDEEVLHLTNAIERMYQDGEASWLIIDITENEQGSMCVYGKKSGIQAGKVPDKVLDSLRNYPAQTEVEDRHYYCEKLVQEGVVYIFGGGHVSQALVPALAAVDFRCILLEDREEFCRPELFRGVEKTILIDNQHVNQYIKITEDDYVCIMTRGHKDDLITQAQVLKSPACYIGVIGSAKKKAGVFSSLKEMGYTDADLARITTPIGLEIQAETPAEIAVSITAQMILVRAEKKKNNIALFSLENNG